MIKREEDLIADGYDLDEIKAIPSYTMLTNPEELARDTVDEHMSGGGDDGMNDVNRMILVTEHYVRMDYAGAIVTVREAAHELSRFVEDAYAEN